MTGTSKIVPCRGDGRRGALAGRDERLKNRRGGSGGARSVRSGVIGLALVLALVGCSFQRLAVDVVGDAITGDGTTFSGDDDPQLIREALPFGLKTYESMLEVSPDHRGLLLACAKGFTVYAYLIQSDADALPEARLGEARRIRARARKLYLRGRDYALRGLEAAHPGFGARLAGDRAKALARTTREDVPLLYWAGAAWGGALSVAKDDLNLVAELPVAGALVGRVLALDEGFDYGAAHEFFISYEAGRPGGSTKKARGHYRKAAKLSRGRRASIHVTLAEAVSVPQQNLKEFKALLAKAKAFDVDSYRPLRLSNVLAVRRARWLERRIPDLFLDAHMAEASQ
ncbi:MAG: TRAP transporter TatT component family protein [Alphaproteobacteria bacterium]|nr:TRAP transporter TatT component family protein [Alphaproteobacteria bacterium]